MAQAQLGDEPAQAGAHAVVDDDAAAAGDGVDRLAAGGVDRAVGADDQHPAVRSRMQLAVEQRLEHGHGTGMAAGGHGVGGGLLFGEAAGVERGHALGEVVRQGGSRQQTHGQQPAEREPA